MNGFWYRLLPVSVASGDDHTDAQANWGSSCLDVSLVMLIWTKCDNRKDGMRGPKPQGQGEKTRALRGRPGGREIRCDRSMKSEATAGAGSELAVRIAVSWMSWGGESMLRPGP